MINKSLMNRLMNRPMAAALGALMFGQSAGAADALPEALRACAAMRNDIERLACYDKAVAHIESGSVAPSPRRICSVPVPPWSRTGKPSAKPMAKNSSRSAEPWFP